MIYNDATNHSLYYVENGAEQLPQRWQQLRDTLGDDPWHGILMYLNEHTSLIGTPKTAAFREDLRRDCACHMPLEQLLPNLDHFINEAERLRVRMLEINERTAALFGSH
ncbi:MAG: hypothetical protein WBB39_02125 [Candidatus Saccharimonadales bacterium]